MALPENPEKGPDGRIRRLLPEDSALIGVNSFAYGGIGMRRLEVVWRSN